MKHGTKFAYSLMKGNEHQHIFLSSVVLASSVSQLYTHFTTWEFVRQMPQNFSKPFKEIVSRDAYNLSKWGGKKHVFGHYE